MTDSFLAHGPFQMTALALTTEHGLDASNLKIGNDRVSMAFFMPHPVAEAVARAFTEATALEAAKAKEGVEG